MPVLAYSLLRVLLVIAAGAGLYLAGMRGLLLVVGAVLIGAGLSYVLLDRFRRASAEWLASRGRGRTRWEDRLSSDSEDEDALLDDDGGDNEPGADHGADRPDDEVSGDQPESSDWPTDAGSDEQRDQQPKADD